MTEFIYKVASRGEGKTKWLLNQAKNELDGGETVILFNNEKNRGVEYRSFVEKYFVTFHEVCKVNSACHIHSIPHDAVVLIDNLLMLDMHMNVINYLNGQCKKVYITLDGKLAEEVTDCDTHPDQISIFDVMSEKELIHKDC